MESCAHRQSRPARLARTAIVLLGAIFLFAALMVSPAETPSASAQAPVVYSPIAYASAYGGLYGYGYGGYCGLYCNYGYGSGYGYGGYCVYYCSYGYGLSYPFYSYGYNVWPPYYAYSTPYYTPYYTSTAAYVAAPTVISLAPTTLVGANITGAWIYCTQIGGGIVWLPPGHSIQGLLC